MASEIVEPEIERIKLSLAEENLIEQIRNYISKLTSVLHEVDVIVDDIFKQKFESARTRTNKVYEDFKFTYELCSILARYTAKTSVSIANGYYYLSIITSLTSLTNTIHKLILNLGLLGVAQVSLSETVTLTIQNLVKQLKEYVVRIGEVFRYLVENPSKVPSHTTVLEKNFSEILYSLKALYIDQGLGHQLPMLAELVSTLSTLVHELYELGEKAVWLYAMRLP